MLLLCSLMLLSTTKQPLKLGKSKQRKYLKICVCKDLILGKNDSERSIILGASHFCHTETNNLFLQWLENKEKNAWPEQFPDLILLRENVYFGFLTGFFCFFIDIIPILWEQFF